MSSRNSRARRRPSTSRQAAPPGAQDALAKFGQDLNSLRISKGLTFAKLAEMTHYSPSTLAEAARGDRLPTREVALTIVSACGEPTEEWAHRWRTLSGHAAGTTRNRLTVTLGAGRGSYREAFAAGLRALYESAGVSYTVLARDAEGKLSRSTISNMLTGQALPGWDTAVAFITVCSKYLPPAERAEAADLGRWRMAHHVALMERATPARPARIPGRRVRESDPFRLGVHLAAPQGGGRPALPAYVHRGAAEDELRQALESATRGQNRFILLVGPAGSGKTRLAYEMAHDVVPEFWLLHPASADEVEATVAPRTVVWLDSLDHYLRGGLTRARLQALLQGPGPVIILGAIWPSEYHSRMVLPRAGEPDAHQREREALALATVIDVNAGLSPAELHRARAAAAHDPALAAALASPDHDIFQNLAAGPHLIRRWAQAGNDYGKALITAAINARRAGAPEPLSIPRLRDAATAILTPSQQARAPADWLDQALRYATSPVPGGIAALTAVSTTGRTGRADGYHVADYLIHHDQVADAGHARLGKHDPIREIVRNLVDAWDRSQREELTTGRGQDAACLFRQVRASHPTSLPDTEVLALAIRALACQDETAGGAWATAATCGDPKELVTYLERVLGRNAPETLTARTRLAHWREKAGDPAGAAARAAFEDLLANQLRVLGADHPDTLATRGNMACWQGAAGDAAGAAAAFEELLPDMERVLGLDHPHTITIRDIVTKCREGATPE